MFFFKSRKDTFLAPASPAPKRCVLRTFLKTFSWKSEMKPVVKYGVNWYILLRVPIYVTKCRFFFREKPENHKICQIAARRSASESSQSPWLIIALVV